MSQAHQLVPYTWWLVSRASGIVALGLISLSVLVGLMSATRLLRGPGTARALVSLHKDLTLASLGAIAVHGLSLLGDSWLKPGIAGVTIPFALSYRPLFTGLGIVSAYLAVLLGLSYYARRRMGVRRWRKLHRATVLVWVLAVAHTLGSGSDAVTVWLRVLTLAPAVPITYLLALRIFARGGRVGQGQVPARTLRVGPRSERAPDRIRLAARTRWAQER